MKSNFVLVKGSDRAYLYNANDALIVKGRDAYSLCFFIYDHLRQGLDFYSFLEKFPENLRYLVQDLIDKMIVKRFILLKDPLNYPVNLFFHESNGSLFVSSNKKWIEDCKPFIECYEQVSDNIGCSIIERKLLRNVFLNSHGHLKNQLKFLKKQTLEIKSCYPPISHLRWVPIKTGRVFCRKDIPIVANDTEAIDFLEAINRSIYLLIDSVTGPILNLEEQGEQIPLSASTCSYVLLKRGVCYHFNLSCIGLSARECRNQLVLYVMEEYYREFYSDGKRGVFSLGWDMSEALFRAVRSKIKKNYNAYSEKYFKKININKILNFKKSPVLNYLVHIFKERHEAKNIYVNIYKPLPHLYCCVYGDFLEVGLSVKQALINLLLQLTSSQCNAEPALSWENMKMEALLKIVDYSFSWRAFKINSDSLRELPELLMVVIYDK